MQLLHSIESSKSLLSETLIAKDFDHRRHGRNVDEMLVRAKETPQGRENVGFGEEASHFAACGLVVGELDPRVELEGFGDAEEDDGGIAMGRRAEWSGFAPEEALAWRGAVARGE